MCCSVCAVQQSSAHLRSTRLGTLDAGDYFQLESIDSVEEAMCPCVFVVCAACNTCVCLLLQIGKKTQGFLRAAVGEPNPEKK